MIPRYDARQRRQVIRHGHWSLVNGCVSDANFCRWVRFFAVGDCLIFVDRHSAGIS
jgi:hypothetical protein